MKIDDFEMDVRFHDPEARPLPENAKLAAALDSLAKLPLNALRHPPSGDQCGWFIWGGEFSEASDFFSPLHASQLTERLPDLVPYLSLGAGWRVLLAPEQIDVWFDESLLSTVA